MRGDADIEHHTRLDRRVEPHRGELLGAADAAALGDETRRAQPVEMKRQRVGREVEIIEMNGRELPRQYRFQRLSFFDNEIEERRNARRAA
jgi:hypothetical protein